MVTMYHYDIHEDDRAILENSLSSFENTFIQESISQDLIHADAEVVSIFVTSTITREMMDAMPKLKLIACRSTGFNNVDLIAAGEKNIVVINVPSYGENTVAEYAFALLLAVTRKVSDATRLMKENKCMNPSEYVGTDLAGKTIGVLGTGKIGKKAISIARGFEMNVLAYDAHPDENFAKEKGFIYVALDEVIASADILTVHMPLLDDTYHFLSGDQFSRMKDGVIIINTARGELIDTKALVKALQDGKVSGAGLDVCEGEEMLRSMCLIHSLEERHTLSMLEESLELSMLRAMPQVILSPHLAYNTKEAIERINETAADGIQKFLEGNPVNIVKPAKVSLGKLILIRHTQSEWNEKGMWTGTRDVKLSLKGFEDARLLGQALTDITIDKAFISEQIRTMETLSSVLGSMGQPVVSITRNKALNERDYGEYTGKNKNEMKKILGDEMFEEVRRGWNVPVPHGETLKNVYDRIVPYYRSTILHELLKGSTVMIVSHGNALRALIKYIEDVQDDAIKDVEMMFGGALVYSINEEGKMTKKEIRETPVMNIDSHV